MHIGLSHALQFLILLFILLIIYPGKGVTMCLVFAAFLCFLNRLKCWWVRWWEKLPFRLLRRSSQQEISGEDFWACVRMPYPWERAINKLFSLLEKKIVIFLNALKKRWQWTGWTEFYYVKVGDITAAGRELAWWKHILHWKLNKAERLTEFSFCHSPWFQKVLLFAAWNKKCREVRIYIRVLDNLLIWSFVWVWGTDTMCALFCQ